MALGADSSIGKGKQLTILGYGQKEEGKESRRLIVGKTRAEEQSRCGYQEELQAYPEGEICTSSRPRGKRAPIIGAGCQGDSGGALLYRGQLVGVTSWSLEDNCERPKKKRSTVFARADFAKQWLLQQTGLPLFGEPAVEKRTEFPEAGGAWIEEASWI